MNLNEYAFVVVGSGFSGSVVAERIAGRLQQPVLVIEKRNHTGGNCHSESDAETGIEFHTYGTHIFHTDNEKVWNYINRFTRFNHYRHQVLSSYKNKIYQLPINLETINSFYQLNLKPYEVDRFMATVRSQPAAEQSNFQEKAIGLLGKELYEAFIKGYTEKQWQMDPADLPASIFSRLPFRKNYNENYYFDQWQGIPLEGYARLFDNLLSDKKIRVLLNTDFFSVKQELNPDALIFYSGPIDRFFDYRFGRLSWRTLRFDKEIIAEEDYQGNAVINFPEKEIPYLRIHEPRHLHPERNYTGKKTLIFKEYSLPDEGENPFYPIPSGENMAMLGRYRAAAGQLKNVFIMGRLGDYRYYDMHHTIAQALDLFENEILPKYSSP